MAGLQGIDRTKPFFDRMSVDRPLFEALYLFGLVALSVCMCVAG